MMMAELKSQFERYLHALRGSVSDLIYRRETPTLDYFDSCYTSLSWDSYSLICREILESGNTMLLPTVAPDLLQRAIAIERASGSLWPLLQEIAKRPEYDFFGLSWCNLYETELANALSRDDYSFNVPTREPFPILIRRMPSEEQTYAPQFVDNRLLFSPTLKKDVFIPVLYHSRGPNSEFIKQQSSVHELIHVLQRVFRKRPVPAYPYQEDGRATIRNPEVYVRVGLEDELECQKILVAAEYSFSLKPILHHQTALASAFREMDRDQALQITRSGIEQIDFQKYNDLYEGDLREEVIRVFINEVPDRWPNE
jgi:hypothetical protein